MMEADVIVGKPIPQSSGASHTHPSNSGGITYDDKDNGIRIIGDSCFYATKYIAPANLCLQLTQAGQYEGISNPAPGAFMYNVNHR